MDRHSKVTIFFVFILFCKDVIVSQIDDVEVITRDTCNGDIFQPTCHNPRDAILMSTATYGRMEIGKCISKKEMLGILGEDPKYFGCSSDVLKILHEKCSLKNSCEVKIPHDDMDKTEPCFPGLKLYLHAKYKCIKVVDQVQDCRLQVHSTPQHITTTTIFSSPQCGGKDNPWLIEAQRGQKIKMVMEMMIGSQNKIFRGLSCEEEIGIIMDKSHAGVKNATLCTNGFSVYDRANIDIDHSKRDEKYVYVSSNSIIELRFYQEFIKTREKSTEQPMILIKIESDGCLDIIPPEDTWLKRTNDDIVIGCYSSKQTWYLRCENKKWTGSIGNCSMNKNVDMESVVEDSITDVKRKDEISEEQQIILFVAICALGLVICLVIVCIGAICIKRYNVKSVAECINIKQPIYYPNGHYTMNDQMQDIQSKSAVNYQHPISCDFIIDQEISEKSEENKYFVLEDSCDKDKYFN